MGVLGAPQSRTQAIAPVTLDSLSKSAINALNTADLSTAQVAGLALGAIANLDAAQIDALSSQQAAIVKTALAPNSVVADVDKLETNGSLSYDSMLTILDDAATGGMTSS